MSLPQIKDIHHEKLKLFKNPPQTIQCCFQLNLYRFMYIIHIHKLYINHGCAHRISLCATWNWDTRNRLFRPELQVKLNHSHAAHYREVLYA